MSALDYILESILDPGAFRSPGAAGAMPQGIMNVHSSEELRQLIGFLGSQGTEVQEAELSALKVPENWRREVIASKVDVDKIDRGEAIFRGKGQCNACHPLRPEPALTLRGPSLLDVGTLSAEELRQSIEKPSAVMVAGYEQVSAVRKSGEVVTGRLVERTARGLSVLRVDGSARLVCVFVPYEDMDGFGEAGTAQTDCYTIGKKSSMPETKGILTREDIDALVEFLRNRHGGGSR